MQDFRPGARAAAAAIAALTLTAALPAAAQTLTIGLSSEPTSLDPHYHNLGPNNALAKYIFGALVNQDAQQRLQPGLAESWKAVDDTTWEFKLRQGVKFSDGSDFTAKDFVYTVCRIPAVVNAVSPFTLYTKSIAGIETVDDHTIRIKTAAPAPLLPTEMSTFVILSAEANDAPDDLAFKAGGCDGITSPASEAFLKPDVAIGTGPYKLRQATRGDRIVLEKNETYWGDEPAWAEIVMRPLTNPGARVAALLAGDVDMIENPPTQDIQRIESSGFKIASGLSNRVIYIALDQGDAPTPGIAGDKNPLQDVKVREALSKAINREAIKERIMLGLSEPAGQLLPSPMFGTDPDRGPIPFDPDGAKALLAEAGYPDGFEITLGSPNDRYINDGQIAQAVAQMWSRIGVKTSVDAKTASAFFADRNALKFSAYLAGWGAATGEMSSPIGALVATNDKARGLGGTNFARHSNKEIDDLLLKALATVDDPAREKLLQQAVGIAMDTWAIAPIHYELTTWAMKKDIDYEARADQYTLGYLATPAN